MSDRPLVWVGRALEDLRSFPDDARRRAGYQLRRVQAGLMPDDWKPLVTAGPGVHEIRIHSGLEHRVCYVARFEEAVYVLHAFEKRTRRTRQVDLDLVRARLREVDRRRQRREGGPW